jgi:formiminoglutamase
MSFSFKQFTKKDLLSRTSKRAGEHKIGEYLVDGQAAQFVIIGINESIGPKANLGQAGSENAFKAFLDRFLNMQYNRFTNNHQICVLGEVISNVPDSNAVPEIRDYVSRLDDFVLKILSKHLNDNQIPIVIGGGHNNAYPLLNHSFECHGKVNVINLDPHADYRSLEGRHSGNGFSYAFNDGYIMKYNVLGLHKYYNSEAILKSLDQDGHHYSFFDDWLDETHSLQHDLMEVITNCSAYENKVGLELDLDAIAFMPSSAFTPSGIRVEEARAYIRQVARSLDIAYLHLPEGAPMNSKEQKVVGKALAYLVLDFISQKNALI